MVDTLNAHATLVLLRCVIMVQFLEITEVIQLLGGALPTNGFVHVVECVLVQVIVTN